MSTKTADCKTITVGKQPMDALLAAINSAVNQPDKVPDGWRTAQGWADKWGLSMPHAGRMLRQGVAAGVVQARKFRILTDAGYVKAQPHYALKVAI